MTDKSGTELERYPLDDVKHVLDKARVVYKINGNKLIITDVSVETKKLEALKGTLDWDVLFSKKVVHGGALSPLGATSDAPVWHISGAPIVPERTVPPKKPITKDKIDNFQKLAQWFKKHTYTSAFGEDTTALIVWKGCPCCLTEIDYSNAVVELQPLNSELRPMLVQIDNEPDLKRLKALYESY